jgi:Zn-finger nucleic acid-binding protein
MKCPHCKEHNLVISERSGIEIDYCPECRGIWLDRGELDKILERSREAETRNPVYAQQQHSHGSYQKPYKRKKSFLEELFD